MQEFKILVWKYWAYGMTLSLFLVIDGLVRGAYPLVFTGAVLTCLNIIDVIKWPAIKRKIFENNIPTT
jgi:hypothetical protein